MGGLGGWDLGASSNQGNVGVPSGGGPDNNRDQAGLRGWNVTPSTERSWIAGQNMAGTENAYNNEWYSKWLPAYQAAMDDGSAATYFLDHKDGIVLQDQTGKNSAGQDITVRLGDLYENGEYLGNIYDKYGKQVADQIMTPLLLSSSEQANGTTVDQKRAEQQANLEANAGQEKFQAEVDKVKQEWGVEGEDVGAFTAGTIAAGTAGGALTGAGLGSFLGPVGTVVGGLAGAAIGGVGAWLNQDQLEDQAARGEAQARLLEQQHTPGTDAAAGAQRLQNWAGMAANALNPVGQAVQGVAELNWTGEFDGQRMGDDQSAYYSVDEKGELNRSIGWTIADMVGTGVGAVGQMATGVGGASYAAQMGAQIVGKAGTFTLSGFQSFDDRTGEFDRVFVSGDGGFDPAGFAAIGDIGIDVLQLGIGRGVMKGAKALGRESNPIIERLSGQRGLFSGKRTEEIAGMKFTRGADGEIEKARMSFMAAAPSEFVQYLSARGSAVLAKKSPLDVTPNDLYEAAQRVASNSKAFPSAMITAFGEGTEEAMQTVLEAVSHNAAISPEDVFTSYFYGAAAGAGMSLGSRRIARDGQSGIKSHATRQYEKGAGAYAMLYGQELKRGDWDKMSREEKATLLARGATEQALAKEVTDKLVEERKRNAVESVMLLNRLLDAQQTVMAADLKNGNPAFNGSYVVTQGFDNIKGIHERMSLNTLVRAFTAKVEGLAVQAKTDPRFQQALEDTASVLQDLQAAQAQFYDDATDEATQAKIVADINAQLTDLWRTPTRTNKDGEQYIDLRTNRAVGLVSLRNPVDNKASFQWKLPQVSIENSRRVDPTSKKGRGDDVVQVSLTSTQAQGADFDGDRIGLMNNLMLDNEALMTKLRGDDFISTNPKQTIALMTREFEKTQIDVIGRTLKTGNPAMQRVARDAIEAIAGPESRLRTRYPFADTEIDQLQRALEAGLPTAKASFLQAMHDNHLRDIQEMTRPNLDNEWFFMDDFVQERLQVFQQTLASRAAAAETKNMRRSNFASVRATGQQGQLFAARDATITQTLWRNTVGEDLFRSWQALQYTVKRSPIDQLDKDQRSILDSLQEMQLRISSGMVDTRIDEIRGKDEITRRVISQLEALSNSPLGQTKDGRPLPLATLARMEVPGYRLELIDNVEYIEWTGPTSLIELLLKASAGQAEAESVGVENDALARKVDIYRKANWAQAMKHVLGAYTARELLGLDGDVLGGNLSLDQLSTILILQDETSRNLDLDALRLHYAYLAKDKSLGKHDGPLRMEDLVRDDTPYTAYQVVVDMLAEVTGKELSWNASKPGKVMGRIGEDSARVGQQFQSSLAALKKAMRRLYPQMNLRDREAWRNALENNPAIAEAYLKVLPDDVVFDAIRSSDGLSVEYHSWILDLLTMPEPEAEMVLLRETLLSTYNVKVAMMKEGDYSWDRQLETLSDRLLQKMHILNHADPTTWKKFYTVLTKATSVEEFLKFVNDPANGIRGNEAPFTAWHRDLSEVDPTYTEGSLSNALASSLQRDALADLAKAVKNFQLEVDSHRSRLKKDQQLVAMLADPAYRHNKDMLDTLQRRLDFVKAFRSPLGPSAMLTIGAGATYGASADMTDKGVAAEFVAAMSAYLANRNSPTFATSEATLWHSLSATSVEQIANNVGWLNEGMTLMDSDGTPVQWEGMTADKFIELVKVEKNWPLLHSITHPSVWEHIGHGRVARRATTDLSLSDLLEGDALETALFAGDDNANALLASYLDGLTENADVLRLASQLAITSTANAKSQLTLDQAASRFQNTLNDMMRILRAGVALAQSPAHPNGTYERLMPDGSLVTTPGTELDRMREQFKIARRHQLQIDKHGSLAAATAVEEIMKLAFAEADAADLTIPENRAKRDALARLFNEHKYDTNMLATLGQAWKLPTSDDVAGDWFAATESKREELWKFARDHGELWLSARGSKALNKIRDPRTPTDPATGVTELTEEEWHELSRNVLVFDLNRRASILIPGQGLLPMGKLSGDDLKFFDPSFDYIYDELLDPAKPAMKAMLKLADTFKNKEVAISSDAFKELVDGTYLNPTKLGRWHDGIPAQIRQAMERITSAGAPIGIAQGGSGPAEMVTVAGATQRTDALPDDAALVTTVLPVSLLNRPRTIKARIEHLLTPGQDVDRITDSKGRTLPMIKLNGRAVRSIIINGEDLVQTSNYSPTFVYTGTKAARESGIEFMTLDRLKASLAEYATRNPGVDMDSAGVQITFWNPDDKPADQPNSLWYDGVLERGDTSTPSLLGAWWFTLGGIDSATSEWALSANKKGHDALHRPKPFTLEEKRYFHSFWGADFAGMLDRMAMAMMQDDRLDRGEHINYGFYNGALKQLKMNHWVRYVDAEGKVQLLAADQVIQMQRDGVPMPVGAELVEIPDQMLRTLFNPLDAKGARRAMTSDVSVLMENIDTWTGVVTDEMRARLPGLFKVDASGRMSSRDLFETELARRSAPVQLSRFTGVNRDYLSKYAQGLTVKKQLETEIRRMRAQEAQQGDPKKWTDWAQDAIRYATQGIQEPSMQETATRMGIRSAGFSETADVAGALLALQDLEETTRTDGYTAGWVFQYMQTPGDRGLNRIYGLEGLAKANTGQQSSTWVAPNDIVVVDLESFPVDGEKNLDRVMEHLESMGAIIVLRSAGGRGMLQSYARTWLQNHSYEYVPGSHHVFRPVDPNRLPASVRSALSHLQETDVLDVRNRVAVWQGGIVEENAGIRFDSALGQDVVISNNLIPVGTYLSHNLPTPEQYARYDLGKRIHGDLDTLLEMSLEQVDWKDVRDKKQRTQEITDTLTRAVEKARTHLQNDGTYPAGVKLEKGDIIPLFDGSTGNLVLYRYGYKPPKLDTKVAQLRGRNRTVIYQPIEDPTATVYEGVLESMERANQWGAKVEIRTPLQALGDKLQFEYSGFKVVAAPAPESWGLAMPDVLPGVQMALAIGITDSDSKNNYEGRLDNFRDALAYIGFDFRGVVARQVFGSASQENLAKANQWLVNMHQALPKMDVEVIDRLIKSETESAVMAATMNHLPAAEGELKGSALWRDAVSGTKLTAEQRLFRGMLLYLMTERSEVSHILESAGMAGIGVRQKGKGVRRPPRLFTQLIQQTGLDDELRKYIVDEVLNPRMLKVQVGKHITGYKFGYDLKVYHANADSRFDEWGYLQFAEVNPSGANPVLNLLASERTQTQAASQQQLAMAFLTTGSKGAVAKPLKKTNALIARKGIVDTDDAASLMKMLRSGIEPGVMEGNFAWTPAEQRYLFAGTQVIEGYRQPLDTAEWTQRDVNEFESDRALLIAEAGLDMNQAVLVDFWIRQMLARRVDKAPVEEGGNPGYVSFSDAKSAMRQIRTNLVQHLFPTTGGMVPHPHVLDVLMLQRASQENGRFQLWNSFNDPTSVLEDLDDWLLAAINIGQPDDYFDTAFQLDNDSFRHTFINSGLRFTGMPVSTNATKAELLADPKTTQTLIAVSAAQRSALHDEVIVAQQAELNDIFGGELRGLTWFGREPASEAIANSRSRMWKWRQEGKIPEPVSYRYADMKKYGAFYHTHGNQQAAALRVMTNLRASMAMLNPMLYVGAPMEAYIQTTLEKATNLLAGNGLGTLEGFSKEEQDYLGKLFQALGNDQRFKGMVYSEVAMDTHLYNAGRVEAFTNWMARVGGRWQDPYYGMRASAISRRYVESAARAISALGETTNITPMVLARQLASDPQWLRKNHPAIHMMAMNTIREMRNLKATTFSLGFRHVIEPLTNSPRMSVAWPSTLMVKMPLMFLGYASNKAVQVMGLQGADAALALLMHGRKKGFFGQGADRLLAAVSGLDYDEISKGGYYDLSEVIESVDITQAVMKSGLTHTGLMAMGLMMGGLGLSGEDDEDRRRRRAAKRDGFAYLYDPRDIANDFRNADALFLENIPFLSEMFRVTEGDEEAGVPARSMAMPNWLVKQILSPIVGMERWFNTGNANEILWGFQDALGSMPLINTMRFDDAAQTYAELMTEAQELDGKGDPNSMPQAFGLVTSAVMVLERMLLENSFANMLYVGWDKYDRDPWQMVDRDAEGNIRTNRLGLPDKTGALTQYLDEKGQVQTAYKSRDWWDVQIHALTENRGTMALLGELFTGFQGDYFRSDMVVKTRTLNKAEVTYQDADAMIRAFWKGGATPESMAEVLKGFYIPYDMRVELSNNLKKEIYDQAIKDGMKEYKARQHMNEVWYGPSTNPSVPGLEDIVWGKGVYEDLISYKASDRYYQLNTTYVMGPDGKPWATGISRNLLQTLAGFMPLQGYHTGAIGGMRVTDNRLNSVDEVRGINTGMRALEKIDDSFEVPTEEPAAAQQQQFGQSQSGNGWVNFGRRRGGGGGGGGGGGSSRMYAPPGQQAPYVNDEQMINTSNPIIRRASIRRERVESQKGRLKPWQ